MANGNPLGNNVGYGAMLRPKTQTGLDEMNRIQRDNNHINSTEAHQMQPQMFPHPGPSSGMPALGVHRPPQQVPVLHPTPFDPQAMGRLLQGR